MQWPSRNPFSVGGRNGGRTDPSTILKHYASATTEAKLATVAKL